MNLSLAHHEDNPDCRGLVTQYPVDRPSSISPTAREIGECSECGKILSICLTFEGSFHSGARRFIGTVQHESIKEADSTNPN